MKTRMRNCVSIILSILLIAASAVCAFADNGAAPEFAEGGRVPDFAPARVAALEFTGEEIQMSLEDARHRMLTDSIEIEAANHQLLANRAKTLSYYETESDLNQIARMSARAETDAERWAAAAMRTAAGASKTRREIAAFQSDFAAAQTQRNYDAEVNQIVRDTVARYYQLAHAKEALRISHENVAVLESLYQNTLSMFNLGVVARQDVLQAEVGLSDAKVAARSAENAYTSARMGYNMLIGLDLMQNVTLTDPLEEPPLSETPLSAAVASALENRNEIIGAEYAVALMELALRDAENTARRSSARYRQAQADLVGARNANKNAPKSIEMEVKNKYMNMTQLKSEVELGKLKISNAKELYRLANLRYDAGVATLADAQQAQFVSYQIEFAYYMTLLDYNLAIIDYEQSMTVGTTGITF